MPRLRGESPGRILGRGRTTLPGRLRTYQRPEYSGHLRRGNMKELPQPVHDPLNRTYCFDRFTLDLLRGSLYSGQGEVKLRPKSFELLRYLVENSGRLVGKEELIAALWPD